MEHRDSLKNPRLAFLRREIEQTVLKPFRSHGWSASIVGETNEADCIEISAEKGSVTTRIAVLYSRTAISDTQLLELSTRLDHVFFNDHSYFTHSTSEKLVVPIESLDNFFPFLVTLNKRVEPDRSPPFVPRRPVTVRRLTAENPLKAVITRLQQFTSVKLAAKLVERRTESEGIKIPNESVAKKATGIAFSMRSALDYISTVSSENLNSRVLSLYYGTIALAQTEMLSSPSGPIDLDEIEGMTKQGHGLYTLPGPTRRFADLHIGVLATGFLPHWMSFLGHDTSDYPRTKPRSLEDLNQLPACMVCSLRDLFASMPEIDDLFADIFGGPSRWISVEYDDKSNSRMYSLSPKTKKPGSTYGLFVDHSGELTASNLINAGWPLAEIQIADHHQGPGIAFRARVDHVGHEVWWSALPIHSSPFGKMSTLLLPTVGDLREYRTIAAVTLYALSIMARYIPSIWRPLEGGDEDQYLALVKASLAVWERLLPEQFLESIAGEKVRTAQPGSWLA